MSTQPLKVSTRDFSWGKGGRCVLLTTYHPCSAERQENPGPSSTRNPLGHLGLLREIFTFLITFWKPKISHPVKKLPNFWGIRKFISMFKEVLLKFMSGHISHHMYFYKVHFNRIITVFWDYTLLFSMEVNLWNIGIFLPDYTTSHPRRHQCSLLHTRERQIRILIGPFPVLPLSPQDLSTNILRHRILFFFCLTDERRPDDPPVLRHTPSLGRLNSRWRNLEKDSHDNNF